MTIALLAALLDMIAFGVLLTPSSAGTSHSAFLLTGTSFAILGMITVIATVVALRGNRFGVWTVMATRILRTVLWVIWNWSLTVQTDAVAVNLIPPLLVTALLGRALWYDHAHGPKDS